MGENLADTEIGPRNSETTRKPISSEFTSAIGHSWSVSIADHQLRHSSRFRSEPDGIVEKFTESEPPTRCKDAVFAAQEAGVSSLAVEMM